jgi:signal transduction histidine kinase
MAKQKILIVDDKRENLYALSSTLKDLDAEVIMSESGDEALKNILNHRFALAILDVQMPDMDGYELAEFIRNEEETKHLPIIFLSAVYSDDYHIFKGYSAGAVDFLVKPYEPMVLKNKVKFFLDLDRHKTELQGYKEHLEELVSMRTKELKQTMVELEEEITERMRAEEELKIAKEKAEESDRLKSVFLANMSHEIRTPMNGIMGFADLLKEPNLSGEEQQKFINIIECSGKRMLNIINDLVDISKVEAGQMEVSVSKAYINEQTETLYSFFKPEAERKGIQISLKNALPSPGILIETDREKLYAILTNLIKNAIKYTDGGSIEFGYEKKDQFLEFFVKDTGIGIAKSKQEDIFKRFIQVNHNRKSRFYEGAGLGLAITKAYVEMLGGKIWVESEEEKGSRFYFTIPYKKAEDELVDPLNGLDSLELYEERLSNLKILVAEDEQIARMLLKTILQKKVKEIIYAKNGAEAVEAVRQNRDVNLVLMDVMMPEMDGLEATRQIRSFNKEVGIIAQTAFAIAGDKEKTLQAGCNDYISKPINKEELFRTIKKVLWG